MISQPLLPASWNYFEREMEELHSCSSELYRSGERAVLNTELFMEGRGQKEYSCRAPLLPRCNVHILSLSSTKGEASMEAYPSWSLRQHPWKPQQYAAVMRQWPSDGPQWSDGHRSNHWNPPSAPLDI